MTAFLRKRPGRPARLVYVSEEAFVDSQADKVCRPLDRTPVSPSVRPLRAAHDFREPLRKWFQTVLNARLVFANEYMAFIT